MSRSVVKVAVGLMAVQFVLNTAFVQRARADWYDGTDYVSCGEDSGIDDTASAGTPTDPYGGVATDSTASYGGGSTETVVDPSVDGGAATSVDYGGCVDTAADAYGGSTDTASTGYGGVPTDFFGYGGSDAGTEEAAVSETFTDPWANMPGTFYGDSGVSDTTDAVADMPVYVPEPGSFAWKAEEARKTVLADIAAGKNVVVIINGINSSEDYQEVPFWTGHAVAQTINLINGDGNVFERPVRQLPNDNGEWDAWRQNPNGEEVTTIVVAVQAAMSAGTTIDFVAHSNGSLALREAVRFMTENLGMSRNDITRVMPQVTLVEPAISGGNLETFVDMLPDSKVDVVINDWDIIVNLNGMARLGDSMGATCLKPLEVEHANLKVHVVSSAGGPETTSTRLNHAIYQNLSNFINPDMFPMVQVQPGTNPVCSAPGY